MSIVSFPLQDLLKSIEVDVKFNGYHATAYCQNRFTKEKFICLYPNYWAGYDCFVGYFLCPDDETEDFKTGFNDARLISLGLKEDNDGR